MRGNALRILTVLSVAIGVACASPTISFDPREDWSRYRTWDWHPDAARTIDAPTPYIVGLDRDLARLIERAFEKRGLSRDRRTPDLRVGVLLNVRREQVTVLETGAIEQLSSLHFSPSYQVQTTTTRLQTYERSRLVVFATSARGGQVVWEGTLQERFRGQFSPYLERSIETLIERFPLAGPMSNGSPPPGRDPASGAPTEFTLPPSRSTLDVSS